ncbi:hypothetical protein [Succinimonas amylolytica]|uniref:hypothetical protein n=1 Tax=Succinimonas amylolytica TaxID=83769 RepID=UPI0023A7E2C7
MITIVPLIARHMHATADSEITGNRERCWCLLLFETLPSAFFPENFSSAGAKF